MNDADDVAAVLHRAAVQIRAGVSDNLPPPLPPLPRRPVKWFEIVRGLDGLICAVVVHDEEMSQ